jgi:hypothetical protein
MNTPLDLASFDLMPILIGAFVGGGIAMLQVSLKRPSTTFVTVAQLPVSTDTDLKSIERVAITSGYKIHWIDEEKSLIIIKDRTTAFSFGFFYPMTLNGGELHIGIEPRASYSFRFQREKGLKKLFASLEAVG